MNTKLFLLGCSAICGLSLSSCVVDPYGYPVAGGVYSSVPVGGYSNVNYYDSDYYDSGYGGGYGYSAPFYSPVSTSFSFFGSRGYGNNCNRPSYSSGSHHHSSSSYRRPVSSSHHYASQVTRPSTFRGTSVMSSPPSIPNLPAPRSLSRPTTRSFTPAPAPRMAPAAPSRSFSVPSMPSPSGRAERSSPIVQASRTMSAPSAGRFAGVPSDRRRER